MIWLKVEDSFYYTNISELSKYLEKEHSEIAKKIGDTENVSFIFHKDDIVSLLKSKKYETIIISPYPPQRFDLHSSFFGVIDVHNRHGILTTAEKEAKVTEYDKLNKSLGLIVETSSFSFADMGGGEQLVDIVTQLDTKYAFGDTPKAVFLAGIMGTGKSFFAQCLAGETKRLLVSFNLAKIMNFDNPIEAFDDIVAYLVKQKGKYLLWIDEIEKMFNGSESSEHIKNKFLTFLNDIGVTIDLDAYVVITANDVSKILAENPEMMRSGRVEPFAKVFLDFLTIESAINIADLYMNKRNNDKSQISYIAKTSIAFYEKRLPKGLWINEYLEAHKENIFKELDVLSKEEDFYDAFVLKIFDIFDENTVSEIKDRFTINIEAEYIVDYIDRIYKEEHRKSTLIAFPYVPAEIKEIISQIFYTHVRDEVNKDNINKVIRKIVKNNISIGDAGKTGIDKMLGNKDKFSLVID